MEIFRLSEILESVLSEFKKISEIPRPSKYEGKIAEWLKKRLDELGGEAVIDDTGNVICEFAATPKMEDKPLFVLQAHMDMVCVSDGSIKYNPLTDSIQLVREGEYLKARGTSLGADDGIGIAIILYILKSKKLHPPLRIIFTVDEETGMSGACGLSDKYLNDVKYVINIDSENVEDVVVGCAGSMRIEFNRKVKWIAPSMKKGWMLKVKGLKGGHSGEAIGILHANAIKVLAEVLKTINCEIAYINGGRAMNVIPSEAEAYIATNIENVPQICKEVETAIQEKNDEPYLLIEVEKKELPKQIINAEEVSKILKLIESLYDGVYNEDTSANIGTIKMTEEGVKIDYMPRFHSSEGQQIMKDAAKRASRENSFNINIGETSQAWKSEKNRLLECTLEMARRQGRELNVRVIHGGLECSHFIEKNPKLEIVSLGTTNLDIHSPKERLLLSSVEPTVELILDVLREL